MIKVFASALLLWALCAQPIFAQQKTTLPKVMDRYGNMIDMPVYGSPEAENIVPKRCGTSMLLDEQEATNNNGKKKVISSSDNYVPHTGTINIPVLLVQFKSEKFTVNEPKRAFDQFFNGTQQDSLGNDNERNHGSVAQYFKDMSNGHFTPSFKIYGPVTVDNNESAYSTSGGSNSWKARQLITDAIAKLQASDDSVTDATSFCNGGSTIDCIYIIHAGVGQNMGGSDSTIWAHMSTANGISLAGKTIRWYTISSELFPSKNSNGNPMINGIGVTCHEFSHALGMPDFYPTASSAHIDNQEMEYWDLMDGGEYAGNSYCPTAYTAFEKNEMGWPVDIQELTANQSVSIVNSTEKGGTAYKIVNPNNSNEYLMLECIQCRGWNRQQYGNGLLVYHVCRPDNGTITTGTAYNNTPGYPGMAVVPADGACLSSYINGSSSYRRSLYGDLFPGSGNMYPDTLNVTELSDAKPQPNFCWYNSDKTQKLATNKALQNIKYNTATGVVSFDYIHDVATGIRTINTQRSNTQNGIYTIDGRYVGNDINALPRGIYIVGGRKLIK